MREPAPFNILFEVQPRENPNYPNSLPTPNDIDGSEILLKDSPRGRVVRVQEMFVMKYGVNVDLLEAHNMQYVARFTTVPVPKVYAIYQHQEGNYLKTYILMQYIPGRTLLDLWDSLDEARKTSIAKTLRNNFDQLRQLQHPGYFGNIDGGLPLNQLFLFSETAGIDDKTPFATEDELVDGILQVFSLEGGPVVRKGQFYQRVLSTYLRGNGFPVFTHTDLQRKNIMVQPDGDVVIIDWESASWYPTYWEYSMATFASGWRDDWQDYVGIILDEYPDQYTWLEAIINEILF